MNNKMIEINNNMIQFVKKYDIRMIGSPQYIDNMFKQNIEFIGNNTFSYPYDTIYTDDKLTKSYKIINDNNSYYIISPTYLSNNITLIYTSLINYMYSATMSNVNKKNAKLSDSSIDFYIDTKYINTEVLQQKIYVSKINNDNNIYKYKLKDNKTYFLLNPNEKYNIQYINQNIASINNNNKTILMNNKLDSYNLEKSNDYEELPIFTIREIDTTNIFNPTQLFDNVKRLKLILFNSSKIIDNDVFNLLKPWKHWSVLNSINAVSSIQLLVSKFYLQYVDNMVELKTDNNVNNFSYLTKNEVQNLTNFLISINKSQTVLDNFKIMRNNIEPLILSNLKFWLETPSFFLNVMNNINIFLESCGYNNVKFNGVNLIFNNDINPDMYNNEIASYITNEYTFDENNMIVYRNNDSYNNINEQINHWLQKIYNSDINFRYFGISIHKLLRYLKNIGDQFIDINNRFTNSLDITPEYPYNNPLKFIINKIWENNYSTTNLKLLDKTFQQEMVYSLTFNKNTNIYSSINYLINLDISFFGINSTNDFTEIVISNKEYNISNLTQYKDTILKPVKFRI